MFSNVSKFVEQERPNFYPHPCDKRPVCDSERCLPLIQTHFVISVNISTQRSKQKEIT